MAFALTLAAVALTIVLRNEPERAVVVEAPVEPGVGEAKEPQPEAEPSAGGVRGSGGLASPLVR